MTVAELWFGAAKSSRLQGTETQPCFLPRHQARPLARGREREERGIIFLMTAEEIVAAAMELDPQAREKIIREILLRLDPGEENLSPEEWEKAWVAECERRLADLRSGKVKAVPGEEVFARARTVRSS